MKSNQLFKTLFCFTSLLLMGFVSAVAAQDVTARLSTQEAYVGQPIVLQLSINNASDYQLPVAPQINGCDVRSAGRPSQSSQITIINGRRSENRSVTMQYIITPRRAGKFEIPALTVEIDGQEQQTRPLRFIATKSETDDLLFVEIAGGKEKVFVGQPLDLKLKIWIKPFVDRENNIKLSEADMWQMISEQTAWGGFGETINQLAQNNQRPSGEETLRNDEQGNERSYYLYEIEATVYPKRPGKIDASDVQVVVNYPTEIGKSRDPFQGFFEDSPFGNRSPLSRMMHDDLFASPFSNRLTVTAARPIAAEATVDATDVQSIPTVGRPADYRGAVGKYKMVTQATPTAVSAGDPITLNIGISGTGPMELVQAPPLTELSELTADFKVADQSLAGFVQDGIKYFSTTIRPRREGIKRIPAIPFSFFNPETEAFETVMSTPISINVEKSDSLALDAIVSHRSTTPSTGPETGALNAPPLPDFTNHGSTSILVSTSPPSVNRTWMWIVVLSPVIWFVPWLARQKNRWGRLVPSFQSAHAKCLVTIRRADDLQTIKNGLVQLISDRTRVRCHEIDTAAGALRTVGQYSLANELESFFQSTRPTTFNGEIETPTPAQKEQAKQLASKIDEALANLKKTRIRRDGRNQRTSRFVNTSRTMLLLLGSGWVFFESPLLADAPNLADPVAPGNVIAHFELTEMQRKAILKEAGEVYSSAAAAINTDSAEAYDLFSSAAEKYQTLVDSGVQNPGLFLNLGNAYFRSNQLGFAIANYERAHRLAPFDRQIKANLEYANSLIKNPPQGKSASGSSTQPMSPEGSNNSFVSPTMTRIVDFARSKNKNLVDTIGRQPLIWTLVASSVLFWSLLALGTGQTRFPLKRLALIPLITLILAGTSYGLTSSINNHQRGIIVADTVTMYAADGEAFDEVTKIGHAQGQPVAILDQRGPWFQIRTAADQVGWVTNESIEAILTGVHRKGPMSF